MKISTFVGSITFYYLICFCSQNTEPPVIKEDDCIDSISYIKIDVSDTPAGKIIFTLILDTLVYDSVYNEYYRPRQLFTINPDGSELKQISNFGIMLRLPTISPDGSKIVYTSWEGIGPGIGTEYIYLFNFIDSTITQLTDFPSEPYSFSWSNDGNKIAFIICPSCELGYDFIKIYIIDLNLNKYYRFTDTNDNEGSPTWFSDNRSIIYPLNSNSISRSLFFSEIDSERTVRLTCTASKPNHPIMSPAGDCIAFDSDNELFIVSLDNLRIWKKITSLDPVGGSVYRAWSPNGKFIAFYDETTIYKVNVETKIKESLISFPKIVGLPGRIETLQWLVFE